MTLIRTFIWACSFACFALQSWAGEQPLYDTYRGLVMAGYQGWFNTPDDGAGRNWRHYNGRDGFRPGSCSIDFWPDVREYQITYETAFRHASGEAARVFSSHDASTVDLHFKWMRDYGLDGVFLQRFVGEISNPSGRRHADKVLASAFKSADAYDRAVCVMYDLSGMGKDGTGILLDDARLLMKRYALKDREPVPTYLFERGRPLIAVWGVGFNDNRPYGLREAVRLVDGLHQMGYSVMLGVPAYWRTLDHDTAPDEGLHELIKKCELVMPWFVGRYDKASYPQFKGRIVEDAAWCRQNGVGYVPLCFPGFSWNNMKGAGSRQIGRHGGEFFWDQARGVIEAGAGMIYIAMFDEIDEGTAIFKCENKRNVPINEPVGFEGIKDGLPTDHYLWLAGQVKQYLGGRKPLPPAMPARDGGG